MPPPRTDTPRTDTYPRHLRAAPLTPQILVIDDSALIREAARIALETVGGWRVDTATGGEEGLALAASQLPDAILLDVVMPDMDGIAVAERLRATPSTRSLPIVFLTASERSEDRESFERIGAAGLIAKPFDVTRLSSQLAELMGWTP